MSEPLTTGQQKVFEDLLKQIQQARQKALQQVNTTLIDLYWSVGKTLTSGERITPSHTPCLIRSEDEINAETGHRIFIHFQGVKTGA
ncbi:hypothetical protein QUF61_11495 [Candidatus Venteria ishoeyi]|uniref:hypothetical protein n=1 Tax=Candidatus Venteria ishoeyi TaxID=1899563 RepID=UPI0025A4E672|nr:hypothetical protein [Candidatus Venteria ishoeyi]MDM8547108.1 hypothetical protein [Candidatus Venteria ishoeyi]